MTFIFFWAVSGLIGYLLGSGKDRGASGFFLGLLLGPIGWIITAMSSGDQVQCPSCRKSMSKSATTCPHCHQAPRTTGEVYRSPALPDLAPDVKQCPFCAEDIKAAAIVCKHCGKDLGAA